MSLAELSVQIEAVVAMDHSAQMYHGSIKEMKVFATELLCPDCGLLEMSANGMMLHLFVCSGSGPMALNNYQRYHLAPVEVMELFKKTQDFQSRYLLVPVKGLPGSHVRLPVTSPLAHLILGGASFSTEPLSIHTYQLHLKNQTLQLNAAKFIENQIIIKNTPIDY